MSTLAEDINVLLIREEDWRKNPAPKCHVKKCAYYGEDYRFHCALDKRKVERCARRIRAGR